MASWRFSVGNIVSRAFDPPAAVAPAAEDTLLPLVNLGDGYPDQQGGLQWLATGAYGVDFDTNMLADDSDRADAPTGWLDYLYLLAGTPGLPADAPDWGAYGARTALRLFRPVAQEISVMPGETVRLDIGIYLPVASAATAVQVRVVDLATGKGWEGGTEDAWLEGGVVDEQAATNAWLDLSVEITADPDRTERSIYQIIVEPVAAAYGPTTYVYASAYGGSGSPALVPELDLCALVGHNLPADADVTLVPQGGGTTLVLTPAQPSMYVVGAAPQLVRTWRLTIQMPAGNQPRPIIGEVWLGTARTLLVGSPVLPIGLTESSPGQLTLEAARGRLEVLGEDAPHVTGLELQFKARTTAAYQQVRDEIARLTRFGAEPLMLLPGEGFEGAGRLYHGRIGEKVSFQRQTPDGDETLRTFALPFAESLFAAP